MFCVLLVLLYDYISIVVLLWGYMFIYNLSLYIVFSTLFQFVNSDVKTLQSFSVLGLINFFNKILIIVFFSMAGVPPFWGFFSKIFIFTLLCNSNFYLLFPFFFLILFIGLYFYVQNIRFLNSTGISDFQPIIELNLRSVPVYYYSTFSIMFFILFGFMFTEDLFITLLWILFN